MGAVRISEVIAPAFFGVHRDMRRGEHAEYWLSGGRGSGKSSFASVEVIMQILRRPGINAAVIRRVGATLRESVFEQILWAVGQLGIMHLFRAKVSPMEIEYLPTGQRIVFRGADDPGKLKSIKLADGAFGCIWFEEVTDFAGMADVRSIKASIGRGAEAVTIFTYNPPVSRMHWVNEEAGRVAAGRLSHRSDYRDMPREWLGESFIADAEALRTADERAWRHMYLGECVGTGGQVFANLELRRITDEEIDGFERVYCGLDFGFAVDPDAFVKVHYDRKQKLMFFLDEFWGVRTPLDVLAEEVARRAGVCGNVTCDSADPRMIEELRSRGVRALAAKKGPGSVERGMRQLQELSRIVIDPARCPNAAREFAGYEYMRGGDGRFIAAYPDKDNHCIDAVRYAVEAAMRQRDARAVDRSRMGL